MRLALHDPVRRQLGAAITWNPRWEHVPDADSLGAWTYVSTQVALDGQVTFRHVVRRQAALQQEFLDIATQDGKAQVPTHSHENELRLELSLFELHRPWLDHLNTYQHWMRKSCNTAGSDQPPAIQTERRSFFFHFPDRNLARDRAPKNHAQT